MPFVLAHGWRWPKAFTGLLVFELLLIVGCLVLFGLADNNAYRTKLWQNGFDEGFNSAPDQIIYEYANHRKAHTPLIWSSKLVQYNIVISVLSLFILLVKSCAFAVKCWFPVISALVSAAELALYAVSIHNETSHDMSDKQHPNPGLPWYLSKGCKYATKGNHSYCVQAQSAFALTCLMVALFSIYLIFSILNIRATPEEAEKRKTSREFDLEMKKIHASYHAEKDMSKEERREMNRQLFLNLPKTPATPAFGAPTPRTAAFTQLNGGAPPPRGAASGPRGGLRFREQYGDA
ncbi:hypothetical protein K470DRAFT_221118 [Piedraia hortae CBS 480.64]|uniref:MARVEL domain-containing protein n=1 Tax=Piedraia hortae CBS 480.64 TaxID=1314780 RepID=A0A6A7BTN1_9PEZI|nr:hypothetical protein K470DRAFT_221118 [Piedraia hortae CBS 480.64]